MINVKKAQELIFKNAYLIETAEVALKDGYGRILAEDIHAPISHPLFDQSAVDGYAIRYEDILLIGGGHANHLQIIEEIKAGDHSDIKLKEGEAIRIFTGARVPEGTDTVVMQEFVELSRQNTLPAQVSHTGNERQLNAKTSTISQNRTTISIQDVSLKKGDNIRKRGEQIRKGELALSKGTALYPAAIGFLASLGITYINVYCLPKIRIIITGSEFTGSPPLTQNPPESEKLGNGETESGENGETENGRNGETENQSRQFTDSPIHPFTDSVRNRGVGDLGETGKIYESNGIMLQSVLQQMGIHSSYLKCEDDPVKLKRILQTESDLNDIIIVTGGVSVGKYDFTKQVIEDIGFKTIFHNVSQKPGKPLLFAKKGNKIAFGLPGNPRSVLTCFYLYVYPFIRLVMGLTEPSLPTIQLPLSHDYKKKNNRTYLLAVHCNENGIRILDGQGSHMLQSFSGANAIIELSENKECFLKGESVRLYLLPH